MFPVNYKQKQALKELSMQLQAYTRKDQIAQRDIELATKATEAVERAVSELQEQVFEIKRQLQLIHKLIYISLKASVC
jgi:chromosome segregation ATPase